MQHHPLRFRVHPAFRLSAAAAFYGAFEPMTGAARGGSAELTLGFLLEGAWTPVAVRLTQDGPMLTAAVTGEGEEAAVTAQLRRILGLDADGDAFVALGEREPEVGALQRQFPGFFTAAFPSPYEAAVNGIVGQRVSMRQASTLRRRLSEACGAEVGGLRIPPPPEAVLGVREVPGLPAPKLGWLKGVAEAALEGKLDAERLRALPQAEALRELQSLPGLGPWTAEHVLVRGAAPPDALPLAEPRVLRAVALLLGLPAPPTARELERLTERWRPFRMWVVILAVRHLAAAGLFAGHPTDRALRGRRTTRRPNATPGPSPS